jgi:hypothetical protein
MIYNKFKIKHSPLNLRTFEGFGQDILRMGLRISTIVQHEIGILNDPASESFVGLVIYFSKEIVK